MELPNAIYETIRRREPNTHKGDYGHALILAGSRNYTGSPYLVSQAALRSGCGLVTLGVAKSLYPILASQLIEVMVRPLAETKEMTLSVLAEYDIVQCAKKADTIAVGPGISLNRETQQLVRRLMAKINKPFVVDADGIMALKGRADITACTGTYTVMTPHPGEMARLLGTTVEEVQKDREKTAKEFSKAHRCVLVLKGHASVVAHPDGKTFVNTTGNPGMATAGSGDVLTGIITGLIAQGLNSYDASVLGVYVHGRAGDIAAKEWGQTGLIATDIVNAIPAAFLSLE